MHSYSLNDGLAAPVAMPPAATPRPTGTGRVRSLLRRVVGERRYRAVVGLYRLGRGKELRAPYPVHEKISAWSRGFRVENARLYEFGRNDPRGYVSDYQRIHRCTKLNPVPELMDNKLFMRMLLRARGHAQAETVALIDGEQVLRSPIEHDARYVRRAEFERWMIEDGGEFIFKPIGGCRGADVFLVRSRDGALESQRGKEIHPFALSSLPGSMLVERAVEQGEFWSSLCPSSFNTMRVLTMWTPGHDEPFIGVAVQRMGTHDTAPTDNWSGGGICARIDLETGVMSEGRMHPDKGHGARTVFTHHPDTGARIEGAVVPHWERVKAEVLAAARALLVNRYVGWDVMVDRTGTPVIIEGNKNSDVNLLQVHGGLLSNPQVRRFYQETGVL